jgi:hypothetical protein
LKKFVEAYEEEIEQQKEQQRLHSKHDIEDENVIVVEKSNMIKFSVKSICAIIHVGATIVLLTLAAVGLLCIIYPETRGPLQDVVIQIVNQLTQYFK